MAGREGGMALSRAHEICLYAPTMGVLMVKWFINIGLNRFTILRLYCELLAEQNDSDILIRPNIKTITN